MWRSRLNPSEAGVPSASQIVAGEVDVLPAEWCKMGQQGVWHHLAIAAHGIEQS
jgi:hypothetical protein